MTFCLGLPLHLRITNCRNWREGVIKTWQRKNSRYGACLPFNDLLRSNTGLSLSTQSYSHLTFLTLQVYVALCCSKEWKEEWKGVKLPRLYVLLREHFTYPDDPWCTETLEWWNRYSPRFTIHLPKAYNFPEKSLVTLPSLTRRQERCAIHRAPLYENEWKLSGRRGCKPQQATSSHLKILFQNFQNMCSYSESCSLQHLFLGR